jgi:hypothetical protein
LDLFSDQGEHRFKKADAGIADAELGGMYAGRKATSSRGDIVSNEGSLSPLIQGAPGSQRERRSRQDDSLLQLFGYLRVYLNWHERSDDGREE